MSIFIPDALQAAGQEFTVTRVFDAPRDNTSMLKERSMQVQAYLFFDGRCEEAIEFYRTALDAKVDMLMRFKESPDQSMCAPGAENKISREREIAAEKVGFHSEFFPAPAEALYQV